MLTLYIQIPFMMTDSVRDYKFKTSPHEMETCFFYRFFDV